MVEGEKEVADGGSTSIDTPESLYAVVVVQRAQRRYVPAAPAVASIVAVNTFRGSVELAAGLKPVMVTNGKVVAKDVQSPAERRRAPFEESFVPDGEGLSIAQPMMLTLTERGKGMTYGTTNITAKRASIGENEVKKKKNRKAHEPPPPAVTRRTTLFPYDKKNKTPKVIYMHIYTQTRNKRTSPYR